MNPKSLLRLEGAGLVAVATAAYFAIGGPLWLFAVLALAPDISMVAYLAVHDELAVENGIDEGTTHWELLQRSREHGLSDERMADIETVVEAFETAAFAPTSVEPSRAKAAVERARKIRSNGSP